MACPVSDISQRPLQNAMRLVKVAIQLDSGNRHKVSKNAGNMLLLKIRAAARKRHIKYHCIITLHQTNTPPGCYCTRKYPSLTLCPMTWHFVRLFDYGYVVCVFFNIKHCGDVV